MSKPVLIISGPTATGKTSLAIALANKYNGMLISADSRQIYRGLDIGTGKDHPATIKIHLTDIKNPDQSFSAAEFVRLAQAKIKQAHAHHQLPIIVGGTGFYINALINPHLRQTFHIKPHPTFRSLLNKMPLSLLQLFLKTIDFNTYKSLNNSDFNNPHRLIRKLEIKLFSSSPKIDSNPQYTLLHLSLTAPNSVIFARIDQRVQQRFDQGLIQEIKNLLGKYSWSQPGLKTLAYKEFKPFFENKKTHADCIHTWRFNEHAYARRQKTYLKTINPIQLISINHPNYPQAVLDLVGKWYNKL